MLLHYIKELKNRVILIICSWSVNVLISYCYKETLLFFTIKFLSLEPLYFITTNVTEIITSYFYLSYFNGTLFASVIIFYHFIGFISPCLYTNEFLFIKNYILITIFFIILSILILNNCIVPYLWNFFLSFQNYNMTINLYFEGKLNEYVEFYITSCIVFFFISQLVLTVFFFSSKIKNISSIVKYYRKIVYVLFLILATIFTPPDVFSQLLIFSLSQFFYELLIFSLIYLEIINLEAN